MKLEISGQTKPYLMAHRGNSDHCPENTLAAFQRAVDEGVEIIETDVHLTKDGVIVCIHDETVDRTTDGTGRIDEMTLDEIKLFSASYGMSAFADERVPTLDEVFEFLPADIVLAIELKTDRFLEPAVARQLVGLIEKAGRSEQTVILSFSRARTLAVKAEAPHLLTGFITLTGLIPKPGPDLLGPLWPLLFVNPLYVWMAHRRGQAVAPLDPQPDVRVWYYKLLRCDAILTNDPGKTGRKLGRQ